MPLKSILLLTLLVVAAPGCGSKEKAPPPPGSDAVAQAGDRLQPSKDGLTKLSADTNPYIRNNAKQALESWEAKDYAAAVIAMQKVISLCKSETQQAAALASMAQLKMEIDAAAAKGNSKAKEAAAHLQ